MQTVTSAQKKPAIKVCILVIHGPYSPWIEILKEGQLKTWARDLEKFPNITVVHIFGNPVGARAHKLDEKYYYLYWSRSKLIARTVISLEYVWKKLITKWKPLVYEKNKYTDMNSIEWHVAMPDLAILQGVKHLAAIRKSLELDYDFLVTTVTSNYINLRQLQTEVSNLQRNKVLSGRIMTIGPHTWQQGSFRLWSRDIAEWIIDSSERYQHHLVEDVAMGRLLEKSGGEFIGISNETLETVETVKKLTKNHLSSIASFRCKSMEFGLRTDAQVMRALHEKLT
jgi:hypothetical protein